MTAARTQRKGQALIHWRFWSQDARPGSPRHVTAYVTATLAGVTAVIACLAVIYSTPSDTYWIVDCGQKALVAERLLETRYSELNFGYPASEIDPDGIAFPIPRPKAIRRGDGFVSFYPPAYAALTTPFLALLGTPGLRVPAALGVGACVWLFTVWLTPAVGRRWAGAGGLILGVATPLFFYGVTVWEHSITVALCLGAWVVLTPRPTQDGVLDRPTTQSVSSPASASWRRLVCAGLLTGSACWFREELALMGIALAGACYLRWRHPSTLAALALGAIPPAAGLAAFNWSVYGDPLGPHVGTSLGPEPYAVEVLSEWSLLHTGRQLMALLGGFGAGRLEAALLALSAIGAVSIGWLAARYDRTMRQATWLVITVGLGAWLLGFLHILFAERPMTELQPYNGLIVRMPMFCVAGIGLHRVWHRLEYAQIRLGVVAGLLFLLLTVAAEVQLLNVRSVHWGPRTLLPAVPAIVALALVAARTETAESGRLARATRVAWASLVVAGLLSSAQATWLLAHQKLEGQRLQDTVLSFPQRFVVTDLTRLASHFASLWDRKPILLASNSETLDVVSTGLRQEGVREFLYLEARTVVHSTRMKPRRAARKNRGEIVSGARCRIAAQHRGRRVHYLDMNIWVCRFRDQP